MSAKNEFGHLSLNISSVACVVGSCDDVVTACCELEVVSACECDIVAEAVVVGAAVDVESDVVGAVVVVGAAVDVESDVVLALFVVEGAAVFVPVLYEENESVS